MDVYALKIVLIAKLGAPCCHPIAFVPLSRTTTYDCCTNCMVGVEAAACMKLFMMWTKRLTGRAYIAG